MAAEIDIRFEADKGVDQSAVRDALSDLDDDDLTEKSPVTAGGRELSVAIDRGDRTDPEAHDEVRVNTEGHSGEWSKTSQDAVISAVMDVPEVRGATVVSGGYEG